MALLGDKIDVQALRDKVEALRVARQELLANLALGDPTTVAALRERIRAAIKVLGL